MKRKTQRWTGSLPTLKAILSKDTSLGTVYYLGTGNLYNRYIMLSVGNTDQVLFLKNSERVSPKFLPGKLTFLILSLVKTLE